jgi:hypothetical protein
LLKATLDQTLTKFILVDMFAKSIQGMRPEDAVAWAAGEIRKIYGRDARRGLAGRAIDCRVRVGDETDDCPAFRFPRGYD